VQRLYCVISGNVQGVGFRAFVQGKASQLGINGWVRNLSDGTVEIIAEADGALLQNLLMILKSGFIKDAVENVNANWQAAEGNFTSFTIRY